MNDKKNEDQELEGKHTQNSNLQEKIAQIDNEISVAEAQYDAAKREHMILTSEYRKIKQGYLWRSRTDIKNLKRTAKLYMKYLLGKRDRKELFNPSLRKKKAKQRIKKLKYSLYDLGFTDKALAELEKESMKSDNPYVRRYAAWELALWYANQYSREGAEKCLAFLPCATKGEKNQDFLRRSAILEAESYDILGKVIEAKHVISHALVSTTHADLYLAAANLESTFPERIKWINQALSLYGMAQLKTDLMTGETTYDSLHTINPKNRKDVAPVQNGKPKVSVIIPAFNAGNGIRTAIDSVLAQTWTNLEVIIADDHSTDETRQIANTYKEFDRRVQVITTKQNSGAYTARNEALRIATGDYVTINDADDWSHPGKIEEQATHLMNHAAVIANTTEQARATNDLKFYRRGKAGEYLFANMSSLMFRREAVMKKLGFWDSVRFGADGEFKKRLRITFGDEAVVDLKTGPYSFQRQSESSLTGSQAFGYHGFFMGARKEYAEAQRYHHQHAATLRYDSPQITRPFPVPEPMLPTREKKARGKRHFDVIIASEFRLLGGTNMSNIEEIKAQKKLGLRTGLVQLSRYDLNSVKEINPQLRTLIDGDAVQMLVYGEKVSCDVLIVRHPPILQEWQRYVPDIEASQVRVIINQPPKREYSEKGKTLYDIPRCVKHLGAYFGKKGTWYPIGPLIRESLLEHHAEELKSVRLANADWSNIIDITEWQRTKRPTNKQIRIGRHARDQYVKWPNTEAALKAVYPDDPRYEISILGGAKTPEKMLGQLPANWHVYEFGEIHPKDFLAKLDVFVYYTHPEWVEAFGRVIFEAMAVGVPVIIPPSYKALFEEAAIYAEPEEVEDKINQLMNDKEAYETQIEKAQKYVEAHFGYAQHAARLEACFVGKAT